MEMVECWREDIGVQRSSPAPTKVCSNNNNQFLILLFRGMNKQFVHFKLRRTVENIYFRLFTMLLIILDIGFVITEAVLDCAVDPTSKTIRKLELALSIYFVVEVSYLYIVYITLMLPIRCF